MHTIREYYEQLEKEILSEYAFLSADSVGRERREDKCDLRTDFQRDRDRIIHSKAFRRLKHKTQVFLAPESDHYRTRLTHTLEVSQIARTIARALRLNEDLVEAIALGHDLGHTPFGHAGERALNELLSSGFTHYEQSVRVCRFIEKNGRGLNLTNEVLNGILCHTKGEWAKTLEGKIVRFSDRIAYINHDIADAIRGGIISADDLPAEAVEILGVSKSARINTTVKSIVANSKDDIIMLDTVQKANDILHEYLFSAVYRNPVAKGEESKVSGIIEGLFNHFIKHPEKLSEEYKAIANREGAERAVADYIAGMTDHFAIMTYQNLYVPQSWGI